ncbi:MAG: phosphate/phosphite/phosphonate ABC transporter substrate-binding protein [Acidiferrobacteraceae bacterium]
MFRKPSLFILMVALLATTASVHAGKDYVLGVFPYLPPRDLEKVFAPMAADLGKTVHRHIVLRSSTTYARFSKHLEKQEYDIAFIQPFDYIHMADRYGYLPLATRSEKLTAIVVARTDSPLRSVADLRGKRMALPPKMAAVSRLMRAFLKEHGLVPDQDIQLSYHRSHVACMRQILIREADVCGTAAPALRFFEHKMKVKLKTIAASRPIPHTLFAINPRVPKSDRDALRERIVGWAKTEEGRQLLARGRLSPFIPIRDSDYNVVRELSRE